MRARTPVTAITAAVTVGLLLTGCSAGSDHDRQATPTASSTPVTVPTPAPTVRTDPLDRGSVRNVEFAAYDQGTYRSTKDCRCSFRDDELGVDVPDLYPRGTAVWMVRFTVEGLWSPDQDGTTRDVTGTKLTAQYADRPEAAVVDTEEGPEKAKQLGLPWELAGLFKTASSWQVSNDDPRSFLVAFHVPAGSTVLDLTFDVPSEPFPTTMQLEVPERARAVASAHEGDH